MQSLPFIFLVFFFFLTPPTATSAVKRGSYIVSTRSQDGTLSFKQQDFASDSEAAAGLALWSESSAFYEANFLSDLYGEFQLAPGDRKVFRERHQVFLNDGASWWAEQIQLLPAFQLLAEQAGPDRLRKGQRPVVIAVLDSGVDYKHSLLAAHIWENPQPGKAGCVNDRFGCDTTGSWEGYLGRGPAHPFKTESAGLACPEGPMRTACLHGTHVAGIIAAEAFDGGGGICPVCKILPVRVVEDVDGQGKVTDAAFLRALMYVRNLNRQYPGLIRVVNSSFGKEQWSRAVALLVADLRQEGILVVAAAGNDNKQQRDFPAALPGVMAVAAVDGSGRKSLYSNFGPWIKVSAPGGSAEHGIDSEVISTVPGELFAASQGTSVAAPMVAGVAGLLFASKPQLQASEVYRLIQASASAKLYFGPQARANQPFLLRSGGETFALMGSGLLDAEAALLAKNQSVPQQQRERVQPGCGTMGGNKTADGGLLSIFFLLPLVLAACARRLEFWD